MSEVGPHRELPKFAYVPTPEELYVRQCAIAAHIETALPTFWDDRTPRDYQQATVERFAEAYIVRAQRGDASLQAACIQFPGAGKTIQAAYIAQLMGVGKRLVANQPPVNGIYAAPNIHILHQAIGEETATPKGFQLVAPEIQTHLYIGGTQAKHDRYMWMMTYAMLASRHKQHDHQQPFLYTDLLFADEADLATDNLATNAVYTLQQNGSVSIGASATQRRHKANRPARSVLEVWPEVIDNRDIIQGIEDGYLRPAVVYGVDLDIDSIPELEALEKDERLSVMKTFIEASSTNFAQSSARTLASLGIKTIAFVSKGNRSLRARNLAAHLRRSNIFIRALGAERNLPAEAIGVFRKDNLSVIRAVETGETHFITSVQMGERGTDIAGLRGLVLTSAAVTESRIVQQIGRVVRVSEQERTSGKPLDPAVIVFLNYQTLPYHMHIRQTITPYDVLDLPHKPGVMTRLSSPLNRKAPNELPTAVDSTLRALYASTSGLYLRQRSRYMVNKQLAPQENDLAEVARWTHSQHDVLRRVLRSNGYPISQIKHRGRRIETCSDNALLFLEQVMAKPGEKHVGQIARDKQAPRDVVLRKLRRLSMIAYSHPAYSRTEPISSYAPTPEHYEASDVQAVEAAIDYTEKRFNVKTDVSFLSVASSLGLSKANLTTYCLLAGHSSYSRNNNGKKTDCLGHTTVQKITATLPHIPAFPSHDKGLMNHRSYMVSLGNHGIRVDTEQLIETIRSEGLRPRIYRVGNNFVLGLTSTHTTVLDQAYKVAKHPSRRPGNPGAHQPTKAAPLSTTRPQSVKPQQPKQSPPERFYRVQDLMRNDDIQGTRLRIFTQRHKVLVEHALAVLSHHPEVSHKNVGINEAGDVVIDSKAYALLSQLSMLQRLPQVPFGWQLLNRMADQQTVDIERLAALLQKVSWATQQVRHYEIAPSVHLYFGSPIVCSRLEDMFVQIASQRRGRA